MIHCLCIHVAHVVNSQCSEEDIYRIAGYDLDWKCVGRRLIGDLNTTDIDNDRGSGSERDKRERMLLEWKRSKACDATYGALVKVLRDLKNNATADRVEELERKSRTSQGNIKLAHQHCTACAGQPWYGDTKHC